MADRIAELLELAGSGDEDILLQVESEFALMPETREQIAERTAQAAEEYMEQFAPVKDEVPEDVLSQMAEEAGF